MCSEPARNCPRGWWRPRLRSEMRYSVRSSASALTVSTGKARGPVAGKHVTPPRKPHQGRAVADIDGQAARRAPACRPMRRAGPRAGAVHSAPVIDPGQAKLAVLDLWHQPGRVAGQIRRVIPAGGQAVRKTAHKCAAWRCCCPRHATAAGSRVSRATLSACRARCRGAAPRPGGWRPAHPRPGSGFPAPWPG